MPVDSWSNVWQIAWRTYVLEAEDVPCGCPLCVTEREKVKLALTMEESAIEQPFSPFNVTDSTPDRKHYSNLEWVARCDNILCILKEGLEDTVVNCPAFIVDALIGDCREALSKADRGDVS